MTTLEFLLDLRKRGVDVELNGERLVVRAARNALPPQLAAELRDRKPEIVAFLSEGVGERSASHAAPPIQPVPRAELMPLSFTQERLWYLSQVETNAAVFNLPLCLEITGPLQAKLLQRALDEIASRHEALRTTIAVRDGVGYQRINSPSGLPMRRVDVAMGNPEGDRAAALQQLDRAAAEPFDLGVEGMRSVLVRFAPDRHLLLVLTHHLFFDGASLNVVLDELISFYQALRDNQPLPASTATVDFADYAVWQREWLQGDALEEQLAFWKACLGGNPAPLELPTDYPRPSLRGSNGAKEPLRLPKAATDAIFKVALEEGSTGFVAMLALFNILLHRFSGQDDLLVGVPVANRTRRESQDIVGYVANTLVLRTDCSGSPSFRQVLRRVHEMCMGAFRHQDMPFQKVIEALRPLRDLSRTPIFQVFFAYEEVFSRPPRMADLGLNRVIVGSTVARQDMSIFLRLVEGEVEGSLEYSADLFSRDSVRSFLDHFAKLADSAARTPDVPVSELEMLTDGDRDVMAMMNATRMQTPDVLVHELVAAQALVTPQRTALRGEQATMTYAELESRANRLARVLQSRGTTPNQLVGVCVDRSPDMVVALLAVLKAGLAYVPLDPEFPAARLQFMLEDAAIRFVITNGARDDLFKTGNRMVLSLDEPTLLAGVSEEAPDCVATPESRAYVIYTSGSTGKPKGVEVLHRNVVNFLSTMRERPGMVPEDVLLAVTTLSFDIAVLELFLPLTVGGTVAIAPRDVVMDGQRLSGMMQDVGATVMQATPATWRLMLDAGWSGRSGLRALCGGEALPPDLAARLRPMVGELWNMYGPTETTVWSTCGRIIDGTAPIVIGTPIGNTECQVVDRSGGQVAVGIPGELLIGGHGIAKGYLNRPELTGERFVTMAGDPSARFYRTGDLARVRPDGVLEHLGRMDDQVKVQGFRIELGEIETVLATMPAIKETVAAVHAHGTAEARLVAYVVYQPGQSATVSEVRRYLRERLPVYMVPGLIVDIDAVPRTPNGKVDRRALPDPLGPAAERVFEAPASAGEQLVADTWSGLLSVERIGRHDNFFELGGHSLLSMRAVAAIERRSGVRIDPRLLFFQTVEQIAAHLEPKLALTGS